MLFDTLQQEFQHIYAYDWDIPLEETLARIKREPIMERSVWKKCGVGGGKRIPSAAYRNTESEKNSLRKRQKN